MGDNCFGYLRAYKELVPRTRLAILFSIGLLVAGCTTTSEETKRNIWEDGYVALPYSIIEQSDCHTGVIKNLKPNCSSQKVPAVVFMHGSHGLRERQFRHMDLFVRLGYPVFAPDSFARPNRRQARGKSMSVMHLRLEEVRIAVQNLKKYPWIDQDKLILAGFSEGGITVREYGGDEFIAHIGMGFGCNNGGFSAPIKVAALHINGSHDNEALDTTLCSGIFRDNFKAVYVDAGHPVDLDPNTIKIIEDFLNGVGLKSRSVDLEKPRSRSNAMGPEGWGRLGCTLEEMVADKC